MFPQLVEYTYLSSIGAVLLEGRGAYQRIDNASKLPRTSIGMCHLNDSVGRYGQGISVVLLPVRLQIERGLYAQDVSSLWIPDVRKLEL